MKSEDVHTVKFCADPPKKKDMAKILYAVMVNYRKLGEPMDSGMRRTAKYIRKKPPQFNWMLLILSTLAPNHEIFAKDYTNPKKTVAEAELVDGYDGFYDNLPIVHGHRGRMLNLVDRHEQKKQKLYRMQTAHDKMEARIKKQQAAVNQAIQEDSSSSDSELEEMDMIPGQMQAANIGSDGANVIGNAEEQQVHANLGLGMANLKLNNGQSSMRTRSTYKAGAFVNMGVQKTSQWTQEFTQEELDQMDV